MALDYTTVYPSQITVDATNYPQGKPKNVVSAGDGTGTPWEEQLVQDFFGFLQACLKEGNATISGVPDTAIASDYFNSLRKALREQSSLFDWSRVLGEESNGAFSAPGGAEPPNGVAFDPIGRAWYMTGNVDLCNRSLDEGRDFERFDTGMGLAVTVFGIAIAGQSSNRSAVCCLSGSDFYRRTSLIAGSWASGTFPGTVANTQAIIFSPVADRYIAVGDTGSAPYVARSTDNVGTSFNEVVHGTSVSGCLNNLAISASGILVSASDASNTRVIFSTDGGLTWSDSTTVLTNHVWNLTYSQYENAFYIIDGDISGTREVYRSTDGDTWVQVTAAADLQGLRINLPQPQVFTTYGHALVYVGQFQDPDAAIRSSAMSFSVDGGLTWKLVLIGDDDDVRLVGNDGSGNQLIAGFTTNGGARVGRLA